MDRDDRQHNKGDEPDIGASFERSSHWGSWTSWVAVAIMIAGFVTGGLGLIMGPNWVVFGAGAALFVVGGLAGYLLGIQRDVVIVEPPERYHDDEGQRSGEAQPHRD
ncbi:hypothetical protein HDA32_001939 [Spinactinospora alkalitolerans]|uniref:Uncharacterized protein n=1 Tax=Spinactinospora alkalitolerans TaxID=687207 RepID=A0A852TS26_9ACTN|nr:hypothetical protein [Spinactinospora alkalitolerans]NYE46819.1 hypothetical protein [Spinactinospora alkalitolerans]